MNQTEKRKILGLILVALLLGCSGENGAVGPSGLNSLISTLEEPVGQNCEFGGLKIETGLDIDSNGTLAVNEVLKTDYVCGIPGNNSLIDFVDEPAGTTCTNGGIKIDSGVDTDADGILDDTEIRTSRFICNGIDKVDEQIRLIIYNNGSSAYCTDSEVFQGDLIAFDKRNWIGVDSILFVPHIFSANANFSAFVELYDQTNDQVILNSTLSTNSTTVSGSHLFSDNIYDNLPESEVDLTIRIRAENSSSVACINEKSYLLLYRGD